jgi:5-methylthioadenosine/S-adenosylhomocysteine deaminase
MTDLLIQNCDILRVADGAARIETGQDIAIAGSRIEAVGVGLNLAAREYIDGRGLLAIPGLMNTHAHVPMVLFRGLVEDVTVESWFNDYVWPLESNLTAEDVYWGALLGIAEMIENGVTSVADHYFYMDEVARAVDESGMRAHLAWAVFEHQGQGQLERTAEFVQRWQGAADGRIRTWLGPHSPYTCGPDFLRLCAQRAQQLDVGIHIHVSETAAQVELAQKQYGMSPVRLLAETGLLDVPAILAHCCFPLESDFALLEGQRAGIAQAPKTYMKLGSGVAPVRQYLQHGIPLGLATDGATSNNTIDILEQLRILSLIEKHKAGDSTVFPLGQAFEIAFHGSARVLGMENELGDLTSGRLADIALLRQDGLHVFPRYNPAANLVYSSRGSDVDTVVCNGKVLMRGRQLLTIDKERVKREVSARLERLNQRTPGTRIATYPT